MTKPSQPIRESAKAFECCLRFRYSGYSFPGCAKLVLRRLGSGFSVRVEIAGRTQNERPKSPQPETLKQTTPSRATIFVWIYTAITNFLWYNAPKALNPKPWSTPTHPEPPYSYEVIQSLTFCDTTSPCIPTHFITFESRDMCNHHAYIYNPLKNPYISWYTHLRHTICVHACIHILPIWPYKTLMSLAQMLAQLVLGWLILKYKSPKN